MNRRLPWYVPLMFVLTGAYLLVEIPFSVHLAGVLGGAATADDIHRIEHFGRMLSGMAAAIAVLGIWHFPRMESMYASRMRTCVTGVIVGGIAVTATFLSLGWYADLRAYISDGAERKSAVVAMLAKRSIMGSDIPEDLGLDQAQRNGFIAVMPELLGAQNIVSLSGRTMMQLAGIAANDSRDAMGSVSEAKSDFFENRFSAARSAYEDYSSSLADAKAAYARIDEEAENAWTRYSSEMDRAYPRGWPKGRGWSWAAAWRKVRFGHEIPVPESWDLRNKRVFITAVKTKITDEIAARYQQAVDSQLGKGTHLKPGLTYEQFLAVPAVQKMVRDSMADADIPRDLLISPAMSDKAFEKAFYAPEIDKAVASMRDALSAEASSYEYGSLAEKGKDAVKASILPALAIMMSLIGAIVHIFKFSGYGLQMAAHVFRIRPLQVNFIRHASVASILGVVAVQSYGISPAALAPSSLARIPVSGIYPTALTAAVMAQPHLTEIGSTLSQAGVWDVVSAGLPQPRPLVEISSTAPADVASLSIPIPLPRPVN